LAKPKKPKEKKAKKEQIENTGMGDALAKEELEEREKLIREQAELARKRKRDSNVQENGNH
jgi:hypothetical protein